MLKISKYKLLIIYIKLTNKIKVLNNKNKSHFKKMNIVKGSKYSHRKTFN